MLRRAILLWKKLLEEQPDALGVRGQLAQTWVKPGAVLHAKHQGDNARKAYEEAIEILNVDAQRKLRGASALALKCQQIRAPAHNNLGNIHLLTSSNSKQGFKWRSRRLAESSTGNNKLEVRRISTWLELTLRVGPRSWSRRLHAASGPASLTRM
jgi:tetratricopeptide (TPR) repeat protein